MSVKEGNVSDRYQQKSLTIKTNQNMNQNFKRKTGNQNVYEKTKRLFLNIQIIMKFTDTCNVLSKHNN